MIPVNGQNLIHDVTVKLTFDILDKKNISSLHHLILLNIYVKFGHNYDVNSSVMAKKLRLKLWPESLWTFVPTQAKVTASGYSSSWSSASLNHTDEDTAMDSERRETHTYCGL